MMTKADNPQSAIPSAPAQGLSLSNGRNPQSK
jgi:hypothetical protein